jgi:hypothetical protein
MVLVLGLDGADRENIALLDMPFLHSLLAKDNCSGYISTCARGWWEITTGQSAQERGVWYTRQLSSNSANFGQTIALQDSKATHFWEDLCELGLRVGIVNIPTTKVPERIDGFFISGAGGGVPLNKLNLGLIASDPSVSKILENNKYIIDVRVKASKIASEEELFEKLLKMTETQINSIIDLQKLRSTDMIFYANMALRTLLNLYARQIYEKSASSKLFTFTKHLDSKFERLFNELNFNKWILISDHGTEPYLYDLCLTPDINKKVFHYNSRTERFKRKLLNYSARNYTTSDDYFSVRYIPGVYFNDERFGKNASPSADIDRLIEQKEKIFASLSSKGIKSSIMVQRSHNMMPDLYLEKPYGCFFDNSYLSKKKLKNYVKRNPKWSGDFSELTSDIVGGVKASSCLFSSNTNLTLNEKKIPLMVFRNAIKGIFK